MEAIRQTQKKYGSRTMTVAIIAGLFLVLIGQQPIGKGLVLGAIFSVVNFVLMGETLPMRMGKSKRKAVTLALGSIMFRYVLLAIPLVVAIKFDQFNVFATILGIFMIQLVILGDHLIAGVFSHTGKQK
jgi:hypothetical protein